MTITREQVADLRPGDVVEYRLDEWPQDEWIRGPLVRPDLQDPGNILAISIPGDNGCYWVTDGRGEPFYGDTRSLTVVSRAPRPLYVNHPRIEPVAGDVVRDAGDDNNPRVWMHLGGGRNDWAGHRIGDMVLFTSGEMPVRLRLLVDGETGQVVPS